MVQQAESETDKCMKTHFFKNQLYIVLLATVCIDY